MELMAWALGATSPGSSGGEFELALWVCETGIVPRSCGHFGWFAVAV